MNIALEVKKTRWALATLTLTSRLNNRPLDILLLRKSAHNLITLANLLKVLETSIDLQCFSNCTSSAVSYGIISEAVGIWWLRCYRTTAITGTRSTLYVG